MIKNECYSEGDINYIFCTDDFLLQLNRVHLQHDYYTDIMTFDLSEGDEIEADIFISIDRVKENSQKSNIPFLDELARVMFHGLLHLMGYNDETPDEKQKMRNKEDEYLTHFLSA